MTVDPSTGAFEGFEIRDGVWVVLNDLHEGRSTGAWWSAVIDLSAIVLTVRGPTGLWLLWSVRKRRARGVAVAAVGTVALVLIFIVFEAVR